MERSLLEQEATIAKAFEYFDLEVNLKPCTNTSFLDPYWELRKRNYHCLNRSLDFS